MGNLGILTTTEGCFAKCDDAISFSPGFNRVTSVKPNLLNRFNDFLIKEEVNR